MKKKNVIVVMLILLAVMAIGYGAFSTTLTINGTANISSTWRIEFTEIKQLSKTDGVSIKTAPSASGTTATFDVDLTTPGDYIEYQITVENKGSIDAKIESITATETGSDAIIFEITNIKEGQTLLKQATKTFNVKISYKDVVSQPNIVINKLMVTINYVQLIGSSTEGDAPEIVTEKLAARILKDNTAYADNVRSPYVNSDSGIDFSQVSSAENGEGLYYTNKNTEGGKTTYYFRGDVYNNYVVLEEDIIEDEGQCIANDGSGDVFPNVTESECAKLEYCYTMDGIFTDKETCDRYVSEGNGGYASEGTIWSVPYDNSYRIVRINEDGSVRLISNNSVSTSISSSHELETAISNFKTSITDWSNNLDIIDEKYLAGSNFCLDSNVLSKVDNYGDGDGDCYDENTGASYVCDSHYIQHNYDAYHRLILGNNPQYGCSGEKLNINVGLLTLDEVVYAGASTGNYSYGPDTNNLRGYLAGMESKTLTPLYFDELVEYNGNIPGLYIGAIGDSSTTAAYFYGLNTSSTYTFNDSNPVVNVKGDLRVLRGDGTQDNPYIVSAN